MGQKQSSVPNPKESELLGDLRNGSIEQICTAVAYLERNPHVLCSSEGVVSLRQAFNNYGDISDETGLLERMVLLLGTIRASRMDGEFSPLTICLELLRYKSTTVRKEAVSSVIKLVRGIEQNKTELIEDEFYPVKIQLIKELETIISADTSYLTPVMS